jgi:hypothetical protein
VEGALSYSTTPASVEVTVEGPLPPARVSPAATLGDFLPPSFLATGGVGSAARSAEATEDGSPDPFFAGHSLEFRGPDPAHQT